MLKFFCATAGKSFDSGILMDAETYARERLNIVTQNVRIATEAIVSSWLMRSSSRSSRKIGARLPADSANS